MLLFTVDLPVPGARYRDARNGMVAATDRVSACRAVLDGLAHPDWLWDVQLNGGPHTLGTVAAAAKDLKRLVEFWTWIGRNFDPSLTWDDIAWVRERWKGPLVIKGVLDVADAEEAVRRGRRRDRRLQPRRPAARRRALVDLRPAGDRRGGRRQDSPC